MYFCEALEMAIELENESVRHYQEILKKLNNKFAKKALEFLIREEREHVKKIKRFNKLVMESKNFDIEKECTSDLKKRIHTFVKSAVDATFEKLDVVRNDIDVYKNAMDLERRKYHVYQDYFEREKDERVKKFLTFLMEEEKLHYELLLQSKKYLEDPSYYFEDAGGWIFS